MPEIAEPPVKVTPKEPTVKDPAFQKMLKDLLTPEGVKKEVPELPKMHKVWLHNDPTTTPQKVTEVLCEVFGHAKGQAWDIMMAAHKGGKALVCVITEEEATKKLAQAKEQSKGTELTFTSEPEE